MKLVVKIGVGLGMVAVAVGLGFGVARILVPPIDAGQATVEAGDAHGEKGEAKDAHGKPTEGAEGEKAYEFGAVHPIPDLIINPRGSSGRRVFKISLSLEYDPANPELAKELEERTPFMRDYLLNTLGAMTEDSLSNISYREAMRDSLRTALNRFLSAGTVDRVLFQDFIRQ
jgi:flagellar basal body-associated protein FliL